MTQLDWIDQPETVCRGALLAAYNAGYFSALPGEPCPYPTGSALAHEWRKGYDERRMELAE